MIGINPINFSKTKKIETSTLKKLETHQTFISPPSLCLPHSLYLSLLVSLSSGTTSIMALAPPLADLIREGENPKLTEQGKRYKER